MDSLLLVTTAANVLMKEIEVKILKKTSLLSYILL